MNVRVRGEGDGSVSDLTRDKCLRMGMGMFVLLMIAE